MVHWVSLCIEQNETLRGATPIRAICLRRAKTKPFSISPNRYPDSSPCLNYVAGQNRFGIPFWLVGEFTTHSRTYFSGDFDFRLPILVVGLVDVHCGLTDLDFEKPIAMFLQSDGELQGNDKILPNGSDEWIPMGKTNRPPFFGDGNKKIGLLSLVELLPGIEEPFPPTEGKKAKIHWAT